MRVKDPHNYTVKGKVALNLYTTKFMERGNYRIQVYHSFIGHKSPKIMCSLEVTFES